MTDIFQTWSCRFLCLLAVWFLFLLGCHEDKYHGTSLFRFLCRMRFREFIHSTPHWVHFYIQVKHFYNANVVFNIKMFFKEKNWRKNLLKFYFFTSLYGKKIYFCCFVLCSCKNISYHGHNLASFSTLLDTSNPKTQLFDPHKQK